MSHACLTSASLLLLYVPTHVDQLAGLSLEEQYGDDLEECLRVYLQQRQQDVLGGYEQDDVVDVGSPLALLDNAVRELLAPQEQLYHPQHLVTQVGLRLLNLTVEVGTRMATLDLGDILG